DLENPKAEWHALLGGRVHDVRHASAADPPALVLGKDEELVHVDTVRLHFGGEYADVRSIRPDDLEVLATEPLFVKPPLLLLGPAPDLLDVVAERRLLDSVGKFAVRWASFAQLHHRSLPGPRDRKARQVCRGSQARSDRARSIRRSVW